MTLRGLIAAVEAAPTTGFGPSWNMANDALPHNAHLVLAAFAGSLDAAKALHDALLPGWNWLARRNGYVCVWETKEIGDADAEATLPDQPARAWLLAILRALESDARAGGGE